MDTPKQAELAKNNGSQINEDWVQIVRKSVGTLQFGVVQIVVHNAKVVQIETTEKVRLAPGAN